ncbi:hypothetical protein [Sulfoacidibacillus thermotolerans]|uniref:Uncharacterized protein n=1 Tax=Sulfoacidibacillus thermotolerans TaxID=1765684 RepID=A0A2U3D085_SULT2|nr:hypothetical protein [Sulfoacidibacillus thermotolerans]PWI54706.1 hypothetical protein BM613_13640 [Sulfoacidibacillus thermotolerans]
MDIANQKEGACVAWCVSVIRHAAVHAKRRESRFSREMAVAEPSCPNGWNPDLAARADYTYGFWMLHGPNGSPNGKTDYEWGQEQGYAAEMSWNNQGCCGRVSVFADIEPDGTTNQWLTSGSLSDQGRNLEVLKGFVDALVNPPSDSPIPSTRN